MDLLVDLLASCRWNVSAIVSASSVESSPRHDELLGVELADASIRSLDLAVHQRLGERRLVPLVVAVPAVADHVDDDVLAERLAEVERQLADVDDRLGVLAVDVEDRHLDHLGDVGAVAGRAARRSGAVVKPIWLLTTMWIVPPVV